jgi:hypothetical protein
MAETSTNQRQDIITIFLKNPFYRSNMALHMKRKIKLHKEYLSRLILKLILMKKINFYILAVDPFFFFLYSGLRLEDVRVIYWSFFSLNWSWCLVLEPERDLRLSFCNLGLEREIGAGFVFLAQGINLG